MVITINYEVVYCANDDEYKVHCEICDKLCIERYYKNHLKSRTHANNNRKDNKTFEKSRILKHAFLLESL